MNQTPMPLAQQLLDKNFKHVKWRTLLLLSLAVLLAKG